MRNSWSCRPISAAIRMSASRPTSLLARRRRAAPSSPLHPSLGADRSLTMAMTTMYRRSAGTCCSALPILNPSRRRSSSGSALRHSPDLAAKLVFDMNADDLIETLLGLKAQRRRTPGVEILRPAGDDLADHRIGLAADEAHGLFAGDPAQRLDLLADGGGKSGQSEVAARTQHRQVHAHRMKEE